MRMRAHLGGCIRWIDRSDPDHKHGLEIVRESVDRLGGEFPPLEKNQGDGATATVFLPAQKISVIGKPGGWPDFNNSFNLNLAVSNFADDFPPHSGIKLEVRLNVEDDLWITGKETELTKILLNLCFNARDSILAAKRDHGMIMIVVTSSAIPGTAILRVSDNGIGLAL